MSIASPATHPVLIAGTWREANAESTFQATDPNRNEKLDAAFPVSSWKDCDEALDAAVEAA
ncbi:MAG: aldehyde dehydrogenase (NADP(+)), partial [Rhodopirellula bahusiensis]